VRYDEGAREVLLVEHRQKLLTDAGDKVANAAVGGLRSPEAIRASIADKGPLAQKLFGSHCAGIANPLRQGPQPSNS
jgi:hypothetical protein